MSSIKALFIGSVVTIILGLFLQLVLLLMATGYTVFIRDYPSLQLFSLILSYGFGVFCYFIVMSIGGYITSNLVKKHVYLHCIFIGLFTTGISLVTSVREDGFTLNTIIFILSGTAFTMMGGYIWSKNEALEKQASLHNSSSS
jgi:hypothetical protein